MRHCRVTAAPAELHTNAPQTRWIFSAPVQRQLKQSKMPRCGTYDICVIVNSYTTSADAWTVYEIRFTHSVEVWVLNCDCDRLVENMWCDVEDSETHTELGVRYSWCWCWRWWWWWDDEQSTWLYWFGLHECDRYNVCGVSFWVPRASAWVSLAIGMDRMMASPWSQVLAWKEKYTLWIHNAARAALRISS